MRVRVVCLVLLLSAGFLTLSLTRGQDRLPMPLGPPSTAPAAVAPPAPRPVVPTTAPVAAPRTATPALDPGKLEGRPRELYYSAYRGGDWLARMNLEKGRFLDGLVTA